MKKRLFLLCSMLLLVSSCNLINTPSTSGGESLSSEATSSDSLSESESSSVNSSSSSQSTSTSSTSSTSHSSTSTSSTSHSSTSSTSSVSHSSASSVSSASSTSHSSSSSVAEVAVTDITMPAGPVELKIGKTYKINASVVPSNATNKKLTYTSLNPDIASVDSAGNVKANSTGTATIQVKSSNNITKTLAFNISLNDLPALGQKAFTATTAPYYGNEYFYAQNMNPQATQVANGVVYTKYTYNGVDASSKSVYTITVDLNLASITVGTRSNSYAPTGSAILMNQATAFENATNKKVYAAVNGDYFGAYSSAYSNGFIVKDGVAVSAKSAFYENLVNGMLALSISYNDVATIAMSAPNASTFYRVDNHIELYDANATKIDSCVITAIDNQDLMDMHSGIRPRNYEVVTQSGRSVTNQNVVYVTKTKSYNEVGSVKFPFDGRISLIQKNYTGSISLNPDQVALLVPDTFANKVTFNHQVRVGVTISDNDAFSNVKTVIGGRHNLIEDYQIVPNLSKETTNDGTKSRARTCLGILGDGRVVIFVCEDGTKGLNLVKVADFMRYIGCRYAFNLDGGGSTGLLVRESNALKLKAGLNTRALANTVLVVEK